MLAPGGQPEPKVAKADAASEAIEPTWEKKFECLEDVSCVVCTEILLGALARLSCGHVFHRSCLVPLQEDDDDKVSPCPLRCGTEALPLQTFTEPSLLHQKIREAPVRCSESCCAWEGTLDQFVSTGHHEAHVDWKKEASTRMRRIEQLDGLVDDMKKKMGRMQLDLWLATEKSQRVQREARLARKEAQEASDEIVRLRRAAVGDAFDSIGAISQNEGEEAALLKAGEWMKDIFNLEGKFAVVRLAPPRDGVLEVAKAGEGVASVMILNEAMQFEPCRFYLRLKGSFYGAKEGDYLVVDGFCVTRTKFR